MGCSSALWCEFQQPAGGRCTSGTLLRINAASETASPFGQRSASACPSSALVRGRSPSNARPAAITAAGSMPSSARL
jgi:hypothetical protein